MATPVRKIDVFAGVNLLLFLVLCVFRYRARFVAYRGPGHLEEFFVYAGVILGGILFLWWAFRRHTFDWVVLVLLQVGILMHFSGAFVPIGEGRLYDAHLLGIRYDKYVHLVNAFAIAFLMGKLFRMRGIPRNPLHGILLLLAVLGLGAIIEMVEYLVVLTVRNNGVGDYDNNMQDLLANLCGSLAFLAVRAALGRGSPGGGGHGLSASN
jgi:putative membrane protein